MANCVNIKHPDFISLQKETNINPVILQAKISIWQSRNDLNAFPSKEDLTKEIEFRKEKTTNLTYQKNYSLFTGNNSNSKQILEEILKNPKSITIKKAAEWLLENNHLNNINISLKDSLFKQDATGSYSVLRNEVELIKDFPYEEGYFQRIVLHELVHSLTSLPIKTSVSYLRENFIKMPNGKFSIDENFFKFLENTDKETKDYITTLINLRNDSYQKLSDKYGKEVVDSKMKNDPSFYGLTNISEFVSEVFTNDIFKNELELNNPSIFQKIIKALVKWINNTFKTEIKYNQNNAEQAIEAVIKYTKLKSKNDFGSGTFTKFADSENNVIYSKEKFVLNENLDFSIEKDNTPKLNKTENYSFISSMTSSVVDYFYNKAFNKTENLDENIKNNIKETILKNLENGDFHQKALKEKFENEFENLWKKTIQNVNKNFKIDFNEDNLDIETLDKDWESEVFSEISGSQSASSGVKWFILSTKKIDKEGNIIKNPLTGLEEYLKIEDVFNIMLEKLTKTTSVNDLINTLRKMSDINPSFNLMADRLSINENLLNMLKTEFNKIRGKSLIVTYAEDFNGNLIIKSFDEFNKSRPEKIITEEWNSIVNFNIGENIEDNKYLLENNKNLLKSLDLRLIKINNELLEKDLPLSENNILTEKGIELKNLLKDFNTLVGINSVILSDNTIDNIILTSRNVKDVLKIINTLKDIREIASKNKKNDIDGKLLTLADEEKLFRNINFEIMQTNVKGKPIFPYTLPSYITKLIDKYTNNKSKESKEELENELKNKSLEPSMQFDNLLWNDTISEGFLNYTLDENKVKIFKDVNWEFLSKISVLDIGGAKNESNKEGQQYKDMGSKDFMLNSLSLYLGGVSNRSDKIDYIYLPIATPSDSGNSKVLKTPRIPLHKHKTNNDNFIKGFDLTKDKPFGENAKKHKLYTALFRTCLQEIQRIRQANKLIFNEKDLELGVFNLNNELLDINSKMVSLPVNEANKLALSKIGSYIQYYHYRELSFDNDGKINLKNTFLKNNRPTGNVFYFSNMVINNSGGLFETNEYFEERNKKNPTKFITLSDVKGFTENGAVNYNIENTRNVILENFIQEFSKQEVNKVIEEAKDFKNIFKGKTDFIQDGTFKDFISEFALNEYIHLVNCQNWFTGVTSFYKSTVDITKRAKEIIAPGRQASNSGKQEFKAVTISDVILPSKSFDILEDNVKKILKKERNFKTEEELNEVADNILKGYKSINTGDAQGYITLQGLKDLLLKHGKYTTPIENLISKIEKGVAPNIQEIETLQAVKPFEYDYKYDTQLNLTIPSQVKLSYVVLIPQLIEGTELELINNEMLKKDISRLYFESAHKVGSRAILPIHNTNGSINQDKLNLIEGEYYKYDAEQIQLEIPAHLEDSVQKLATQIAKLIVANLSDTGNYTVNGKDFNGSELKDYYFDLLVQNIEEDSDKLIKDLNIEKDGDGNWVFKNKEKLKEILTEEVINRGLSDNYLDSLELNENGEFVLPLFINNMSKKWESILTSIFSNRIMRQKIEGASVTLTSTFGLKKLKQDENNIKGIEWADSHKEDNTLKVYKNNKNETVVQVVMGSWSKKFFDENGLRIDINKIPLELREMVGYRIPTQAKHSMIVLEVVGFLPEQSKGMIITPDDMVVQMGSDFDIDKLFLMYKNFYTNKEGEFIIPKYSGSKEQSEKEIEDLKNELKEIKDLDKEAAKFKTANLISNMGGLFAESVKDLENELVSLKKGINKSARNNEIIEIYKTILKHDSHQKEIHTPAEFESLKEGAELIKKIYKNDDKNVSPVSGNFQRQIRQRNMDGRTLKGIAANYNAFGAISQISKMKINNRVAFKSKIKISGKETEFDKVYDLKELEDKYGKKNIEVKDDFVIIKFTSLGFNDSNNLNIENKLILENASQGLGASVDNAKDPVLGTLNLNMFTYAVMHTSLLLGQNTQESMFYYRQPIIKELSSLIEDNKKIIGDKLSEGKEREYIRQVYKGKAFKVYFNNFKERLDSKINDFNSKNNTKYDSAKIYKSLEADLKFIPKKLSDFLFENDFENVKVFSAQELYDMLIDDSLDIDKKLEPSKQIKLYINQMQILNDFGNRKGVSEVLDKVLQVTKTDSIGAGPEINNSTKLINNIYNLSEDSTIEIDNVAVVKKIYPKHFGLDEKSKYPPLESYFENVNKISKEILSPLFISESAAFKSLKKSIFRKIKGNEKVSKEVDKFLNFLVYQDFEYFDNLHFERVLGIKGSKNSFFDKVQNLKNELKEELINNPNHVLNMFELSNNFSELGYKEVKLKNYKDPNLDNSLSEQLYDMYLLDDLQKDFVEDLVKYTYFIDSLNYNFGSFSKIIPTKLFSDIGLNEYAYDIQEKANNSLFFNDISKELFFRNNSHNKDIIPIAKTKYQLDSDKKLLKKYDEQTGELIGYETINNTPVYNLNNGILTVTKKQMANENDSLKNSDFLSYPIYNKETKQTKFKLLKKLDLNLLPVNTEYNSQVGDIINIDFNNNFNPIKVQITNIEKANSDFYLVDTINLKTNKKSTYEIHESNGHVLTITNEEGSTSVPLDVYIEGFQISNELLENPNKTPIFDINSNINIYYEINKLGKNGIYEVDTSSFEENLNVDEIENYKNALIKYLNVDVNKLGFLENSLKEIEERKNTCGL